MKTAEQRFERRLLIVEAVHRGEKPTAVAKMMGIPLRTVFHWLAVYRNEGKPGLKDNPKKGRNRKVNAGTMAWLYQAVTLNDPQQFQFPFSLWTLNAIRQMLKKFQGIELSKSGVSRLLKHLGLSPQRPLYRSYKQDPKQLENYLNKTFPEIKARARRMGAEIYFVDESAVRSDHHHGTTWAPKGQTPQATDTGDRFGFKMISAVNPRGDMRFSFIEGKMNSGRFIEFLKQLQADVKRPLIVIVDNARYHTSAKVKTFEEETQPEIQIETLPCYAPELNPDEQVWNHLKRRVGKLFFKTKMEMKQLLMNILRSIQRNTSLVQSFFRLPSTRYILE